MNTQVQPTALTILDKTVRMFDGLYSLNDLHKASGSEAKYKAPNFIRLDTTQDLIKEIEQVSDVRLDNSQGTDLHLAIKTVHGGTLRGTYVCRELVYAYAMWISAKFHLLVIRAFDAMHNQKAPTPTTDPHWQIADTVDELVKQGVANKRTLYNRLYRRFSVDSYKKIPVEQCQAAVDYLKRMATTSPQQEPISLNDGEWYLVVKDGVVLWDKRLKPHCNDIPKNVIKNPKLMLEHIREVVGEFIGKDALPAPQPPLAISYPVRAAKPPKGSSGSMGNQHYFRATDFVDGRFDPIRDFLDDLERAGYEVAGLKIINIAKTWIIKEQHQDLLNLNQLSSRFLSQLGDFHQQQKNIATKGMNVCWLNPDLMQIVQKYQ